MSTRKIGKICDKHPELGGERLSSNGSCVRCHRDKVNASRLRRYHSDPVFKEVQNEKNRAAYREHDTGRYLVRRANIKQQTPIWADLEKIKAVYKEARHLGLTVDHIIPLRGEIVSGLHVHNNLQLMPASANSSKGNSFPIKGTIMTHKVDLIVDFQYGSTGKGLIAGYLAKRGDYDTVICAFATNAGHTYIDKEEGIHVMTQQLPTAAVVSKTVKTILLGPGSLIHMATLFNELEQNKERLVGKRLMIHPQAAVVEGYHAEQERQMGMSKIGSTTKGVGAAMIERIKRDPESPNTVSRRWKGTAFEQYVVTEAEYRDALLAAENVIIEGAQGFSLSMYHGQYPYTTSRDVTPWQILADCGVPFRWATYVHVIGTARTYPIRVNNRDGSSGPNYPDQLELAWETFDHLGVAPELTTVTKLKRRIFTFSQKQIQEAVFHCGGYWDTSIFLNFANYCSSGEELRSIISQIEAPGPLNYNPPRVAWIGYGADDVDLVAIPKSGRTSTNPDNDGTWVK